MLYLVSTTNSDVTALTTSNTNSGTFFILDTALRQRHHG